MGWDFKQFASKKDIIRERCKLQENEHGKWETLAHCVRGNVLWSVKQVTVKTTGKTTRFIMCDLLGAEKGFGWGYKDMDESMGPCYYSCPLSFLDMAPEDGTGNTNPTWREQVRAYAAQAHRKVQVGEMYTLEDGRVLTVLTVRPLRVSVNLFGVFRCSRKLLTDRVETVQIRRVTTRMPCSQEN